MPKDGGGFVDVGVNLGHTVIDLQCAAPTSRYIGFEPNVAARVSTSTNSCSSIAITDWQVVPTTLAGTEIARLAFDDVRRA